MTKLQISRRRRSFGDKHGNTTIPVLSGIFTSHFMGEVFVNIMLGHDTGDSKKKLTHFGMLKSGTENLIDGFTYLTSNYMENIQLLSKWIMRRYLVLWEQLHENDFTFDDALGLLGKMQNPDSKKLIGLFLSELRKSGWLYVRFDPDDARKRIYKLKPYEQIFSVIVNKSKGGE